MLRNFGKSLLVMLVACGGIFLTSIVLAQPAQADVFYGTRTCELREASQCPFGMVALAGADRAIYCVNPTSNYCRQITGNASYSPKIGNIDDNNNFVPCSRPSREGIATCVLNDNTNGNLAFTPSGLTIYREFLQRSTGFTANNLGGLNISRDSFECNELDNGGVTYPVIPKIFNLDTGIYDTAAGDISSKTLARWKIANDAGFVVGKGDLNKNPEFCTAGEVYIGIKAGVYDTHICVKNINQVGTMKPCVVQKTGSTALSTVFRNSAIYDKCFLGAGAPVPATDIDPSPPGAVPTVLQNIQTYYYERFRTGGATPDTNANATSLRSAAANDNRCKVTAQEIMSTRSNTGCSTFARYDAATNTLVATEEWQKCSRCIYGAEPRVNRQGPVEAQSNQPVDRCALYGLVDAAGNPTVDCPATGIGLTPDTEPFGDQIAGAIYTEAGCIGTDNISTVVNTVVRIALGVMGGIVILRIIQGALTMQQGSPEAYEEGRAIIISALVGLLVLIFSAAILNFLGVNILNLRNFPRFG